jgi:hypothetical protein
MGAMLSGSYWLVLADFCSLRRGRQAMDFIC